MKPCLAVQFERIHFAASGHNFSCAILHTLAAIENINLQIDAVSKELAKYGWDSYNVKILLSFLSVCSVLFFVYLVTIAILVYAFISNMFVSLSYISFVRFIIALLFFAHIN
jgi:hypothetical protein